jgi:ATP-dependent RNA helicase RhlE
MSFKDFDFNPRIVANIKACGYETPTPIQAQAIPDIIKGRDIMGLAQTGTGKTAAFVLPMLQKLSQGGGRRRVRAVIVAPTRELAEQIHENISELGRNTGIRSVAVYGGVSKFGQLKMFKSGVEIIVACPGRLLDHLDSRDLDLSGVEMLVLDEADMMFDMGFMPAIKRLLKYLPQKRQNLLFSATMPNEIRHLADSILNDPARVQINHSRPTALVSHKLYRVEKQGKGALLKQVMQDKSVSSALVFTRTKYAAKKLAISLEKAGHRAVALQGNMSQNQRKLAMDGFRRGQFNIMVATDIAARGIDVSGISHVINYDVPATVEAYTHRIGRTGRADRTGEAFTFATGEDRVIVKQIEQTIGSKMVLLSAASNGTAAELGSKPVNSDVDGNRSGYSAGKAAETSKGGASSSKRHPAGQRTQGGGGGQQPRNGGGQKKASKPHRRRSAPLGVDFFTQSKRSGTKTGRNAV